MIITSILSIVFIPDNNNYKRFIDSFNSFIKLHEREDIDKIIIDGYIIDEYIDDIKNLVKDHKKVILNVREKNIGKSTIINENIHKINKRVLLMDSDIILLPDSFERMSKMICDVVIPNQMEDCRHYSLVFKTPILALNEYVHIIKNNTGVSGGCMLVFKSILHKIPFRNKGCYGSDDVEFLEDCLDNNFHIVLCKNVYIVHPFDVNKEYYKWKVRTSMKYYKKDLTEKDIEESNRELEKIWKKKRDSF